MSDRVAALIVTASLLSGEDGFVLHPNLEPWHHQLIRRRRTWFHNSANVPVSCYARLLGENESSLLAASVSGLPSDTAQVWLASPYHAQLARDTVRLLPEGQLSLHAQDAEWLCAELNPMLKEDGMMLMASGAALFLCCREAMDAQPADFGSISGACLPDRHPKGSDGGRLMRLLSEIQMHLHRHPAAHRRERGECDIHGLWFWAPAEVGGAGPDKALAVATRNPCLQAVVDGRDACMIISEADCLPELLHQDERLPEYVLLTGTAHALLLSTSLIPRIGKASWQAKSVKEEAVLTALLQGWADAA